eukprot:TRINITY_DN26062_c0_g1_i1.p1 TRINITY_DN26062_c0_g1~~TRINITY_DN26062_c0_g1_i1.p1  ORF type:complete len:572 (+),score=165.09 TRINITY_DN26062_c0_g1_i1:142-1857(+)
MVLKGLLEEHTGYQYSLLLGRRDGRASRQWGSSNWTSYTSDEASGHDVEEKRAEPRWQALATIYYKNKIQQARVEEREAALGKVIEERKIARAQDKKERWTHESEKLRQEEAGLEQMKPQDAKTAEQLIRVAEEKQETLDKEADAGTEEVEANDRLREYMGKQLAAQEQVKEALKGIADAHADLQATLKANSNKIPGRPAIDEAGQIVTQRDTCKRLGMEYIDGKGCFVPGTEKEESPADIAAAEAAKVAQNEEASAREKVSRLREAASEAHASELQAQADVEQLSKPGGDEEKLARAKADLKAAQDNVHQTSAEVPAAEKSLKSTTQAVLQAQKNQIDVLQEERYEDNAKLSKYTEDEHKAANDAQQQHREAAIPEGRQAGNYEREATSLMRSARHLRGEPDRQHVVQGEAFVDYNRAKHAGDAKTALGKSDMKGATKDYLRQNHDAEDRRTLDHKLLVDAASTGSKTTVKQPSLLGQENRQNNDELNGKLRDAGREDDKVLQSVTSEADAENLVNQDDAQIARLRSQLGLAEARARAEAAKTSAMQLYSSFIDASLALVAVPGSRGSFI